MKKVILTVLSLVAVVFSANAQENAKTTTVVTKEGNVETVSTETEYENTVLVNPFTKNWEFSLGLGTQIYLGEYVATHQRFKDLWTGPAIDLAIQKWASPYFAVGFGINLSPYKGLYMEEDRAMMHSTFSDPSDPKYDGGSNKCGDTGFYLAGDKMNRWYGDFFFRFSFDIMNILGGYRPDRMYHLIGYLGGGVGVSLNSGVHTAVTPTFNAGLVNQFNINDHWAININVRGALYSDEFNGISYYTSSDTRNVPMDGSIGLTAGFSYKFGFVTKKSILTGAETTAAWIPLTTAIIASKEFADAVNDKEAAQALADDYADKANKANDELAKANAALAASGAALAAAANIDYRQIVNFPIDKWKLSNREKVSIMLAAEAIKSAPNTKFAVTGYADMQTATPKHNEMLSENRAEVVRKTLVEEFGVNPDQLVINHKGGVDYMFYNDPQCSRSVIIEAVK